MIRRNPLPLKPDFRWVFIFSRQIGDYKISFEWVRRRYTEKEGLNYTIEWSTKEGQVFHTEFGQRAPEW